MMKDKKIIILVVLGATAVISLLYGLLSSSGSRRAISATPVISQQPHEITATDTTVKRRAVRTRFKSWKRSPFRAAAAQDVTPSLVLNGIIGGKPPKAMIGDALVGVGDKIGGYTVAAVKSDRVILNDGTKDFEIIMKQ